MYIKTNKRFLVTSCFS